MQVTVPEPCNESWEEMTPHQKGRFCASCQKCVVDFTFFTDKEIAEYLKYNKRTCGNFTIDQLNRSLELEKPYSSAIKFYRWAAGFALLIGISKSMQSKANNMPIPIEWVDRIVKPLPYHLYNTAEEPACGEPILKFLKFNLTRAKSNRPYSGPITVQLDNDNFTQVYKINCDANGNVEFELTKPFEFDRTLEFKITDAKDNTAYIEFNLDDLSAYPKSSFYWVDSNYKGILTTTKLQVPVFKKIARRKAWNKLKFWKKKRRGMRGMIAPPSY